MPLAESGRRVLIAGGTGSVGRALARRLAQDPATAVRVLSRGPYAGHPAHVEAVTGSVHEPSVLDKALAGVDVAYYLIHGLDAPDFERQDRAAAIAFSAAAARAGVGRIVFLGALGDEREPLSPHIRSRQETGRLLRAGPVPVVELRAAVVLAPGSAVFELLRGLAERIPVTIVPKGADKRCQPIALEDTLRWLVAAADHPEMPGIPLEIGGAETTTYAGLMHLYSTLRGLARPVVRMPIATPRLSGWWIGRFTPVPARVGRELVLGLRHDAIVRDPRARRLLSIEPLSLREAMLRAIDASDLGRAVDVTERCARPC